MKFSSALAAAAALAAGVDAAGPAFPPWLAAIMSARASMFNTRPTAAPAPFANPFANGFPSAPSQSDAAKGPLANPNIPFGATQTEVATAMGAYKNIIPAIPTATYVPPVASVNSTRGSGNSTSAVNSTIVSCANDAKQNPNAANDATHRCNWAPGFDINTNYYTSAPNTGRVVPYTLTITNGTVSPSGQQKLGFLINGQFPGPKIEANWGDTVQVTIVNKLQNNGTSIHWHGLLQNQNVIADGVGGVSQCPVAPGDSATYTFRAMQYGTSWYHSHFSGQYGDGVFGPVVVNGPTSANYDIDLGTVVISDEFPLTAFQEGWLATRFGPNTARNYLLNGQNAAVDGSGGQRSSWTFTPGLKHKLRFINAATDNHYKIQIDGHSLTVVSADLTPVTPYTTKELSMSIGQRYEVIVTADQAVSNYWLRAMVATDCSFNQNDGTGIANGIISYSGAPAGLPTTKVSTTHSQACVDEPASVLSPVMPLSVDSAAVAGVGTSLGIGANTLRSNNDTVFQWTLGGVSQVIDWSNPILSSAVANQDNFDATKHVIQLTQANAWTYWVIANQFFAPHPIHLHGHDFFVLAQGSGSFSAATTLNFVNPPRRDTVMVTGRGFTVIAFKTDNPGAWLMHCHISWHAGGGLSLAFLERPSEIAGMYGAAVQSSTYQNTCNNWKKYAPTMVYKQSDSGLKRREIVGDVEMEMEVMDEIPERRRSEKHSHAEMHVRRNAQHWGSQAH